MGSPTLEDKKIRIQQQQQKMSSTIETKTEIPRNKSNKEETRALQRIF